MIRGLLVLLTFVSAVLFPWPLTVVLALFSSLSLPLLPLAIGLFIDILYYAPQTGAWPLATLCGIAATSAAILVRRRLRTGIIGR